MLKLPLLYINHRIHPKRSYGERMEAALQDYDINRKIFENTPKKFQDVNDAQMTSSTVSSLSSPIDSGVQLLDSESEITSVMSVSGFGCDIDSISLESESIQKDKSEDGSGQNKGRDNVDFNKEIGPVHSGQKQKLFNNVLDEKPCEEVEKHDTEKLLDEFINHAKVMTKSDIINQNIVGDNKMLSRSVPTYFDDKLFECKSSSYNLDLDSQKFNGVFCEMEHPIKNTETDLMNVSLTSYELLDYTLQNRNLSVGNPDMHVSLSEEVSENLRLALSQAPPAQEPVIVAPAETKDKPFEEQIVFRRQRKKKSKSDTPKKRVSFHEDILNSTKIDDIHINHGFITHEPEVSLSFFQRGFIKKPDVVKGRYSWAAEGDAPFYEQPSTRREIKSDIFIAHPYSSTSSSSTGSMSSSIDEEDSEEVFTRKEPSLKSKPKSSCLKKTKHKKYIDTNIVHEEINLKKKKSETNLLDSNIFGSLKNILNFSTSVPLAERGVPEGQEDMSIYSSSQGSSTKRSLGNLMLKNFGTIEIKPPAVNKLNLAKNSLKLTKSEGFYPSYPNTQQNLPANIIVCDSNVYEHKGISYSYEYDKFQKSFEKQKEEPKSSTMYQKILKEFNFFRRRAREEQEIEGEEDFEIINQATSTPVKTEESVEEVEEQVKEVKPATSSSSASRFSSTSKLDFSDNDTISELSEPQHPRHLSSPKRKVNRSNHYSVSGSFKVPLSGEARRTRYGKISA
ncbi:hypothetical protein JTB14_019418 [Gonioctena quinquepunctata]|nr:hypothetical protein JTB14_019418 [Gonioctena quinquepunctata]